MYSLRLYCLPLLLLHISGCSHTTSKSYVAAPHTSTINSNACYFNDGSPEPAPSWLCNQAANRLATIGSAAITQTGYSAAFELAQLQAKAELSRTINSQINSETHLTSAAKPEKNHFSNQIKINSKEILKKSRVIKSVVSSKGTIYILFGYNQ